MDLIRAMSVFARVVESGSMTAAAEQSGISPTMVGNHLRALEQHLGMTLLNRTTRRQSLTEFGAAYYGRCVEILGLVSDSERLAEEAKATPRGTLRVTAPETFGADRLMPRIAEYLERHSFVKLEVVLTDRVMDLLEEGFDAAIRLGALAPSTLIARPLEDYRMTICAAPGYLEKKGMPADPRDLTGHDCLSFARDRGPDGFWSGGEWSLEGPEGPVKLELGGRVVVNSARALRQAALSGLGISVLPELLVAADIENGRLVRLFPDHRLPSRPLNLLYPRDRYRSPKLRSFVRFVTSAFGPGG